MAGISRTHMNNDSNKLELKVPLLLAAHGLLFLRDFVWVFKVDVIKILFKLVGRLLFGIVFVVLIFGLGLFRAGLLQLELRYWISFGFLLFVSQIIALEDLVRRERLQIKHVRELDLVVILDISENFEVKSDSLQVDDECVGSFLYRGCLLKLSLGVALVTLPITNDLGGREFL